MPPEPIRNRTMDAMVEQLGTIESGTIVYGTKAVEYWTTPSLVTKALLWLPQYDQPLTATASTTQLDQGPVLGVVRSSGSMFSRSMFVDQAGPVSAGFEHQQRVTVWGYVKQTDEDAASTILERLFQDTVECLMVDPTLGGVAVKCEPDGALDTDDGAMEPLAFFAQDWLVQV